MSHEQLERQIWKQYCDELEPVADVMVKHIAAATFELGVERSKELLGKAFDLVFSRVTDRIFAELDRLNRTVAKPEVLQ